MADRRGPSARALGALTLLALVITGAAAAGQTAGTSVNWLGFGNTPNENRYSPLTQITPDNVAQLGRVFTFDLNRIVPGIKKGQQSYPIVVDGTIYVTSGDDQVFAVNGVTGAPALALRPRQRRRPSRTTGSSSTAASPTATASSSCSRST